MKSIIACARIRPVYISLSEFYSCSISFASNFLCLHAIYNTFGVMYYRRKTKTESYDTNLLILRQFYRRWLKL